MRSGVLEKEKGSFMSQVTQLRLYSGLGASKAMIWLEEAPGRWEMEDVVERRSEARWGGNGDSKHPRSSEEFLFVEKENEHESKSSVFLQAFLSQDDAFQSMQ